MMKPVCYQGYNLWRLEVPPPPNHSRNSLSIPRDFTANDLGEGDRGRGLSATKHQQRKYLYIPKVRPFHQSSPTPCWLPSLSAHRFVPRKPADMIRQRSPIARENLGFPDDKPIYSTRFSCLTQRLSPTLNAVFPTQFASRLILDLGWFRESADPAIRLPAPR